MKTSHLLLLGFVIIALYSIYLDMKKVEIHGKIHKKTEEIVTEESEEHTKKKNVENANKDISDEQKEIAERSEDNKEENSEQINANYLQLGQMGQIHVLTKVLLQANPKFKYTFLIENLSPKWKAHLLKLREAVGSLRKEKPDFTNFVFVSAFDESHFRESMDMIGSIQTNMAGYKIIVYDLGMNDEQIKKLKTLVNVEYRKFNYDLYPEYVRVLIKYAFKSLVIQEVMFEYPAVHWCDASIRITCSKEKYLQLIMETAKSNGGVAFGLYGDSRPKVYTHSDIMWYLPIDIYKYATAKIIQGGHGFYYNSQFVFDNIVLPWVACALTEMCIAPINAAKKCSTYIRRYTHNCHRFDQTALNIILFNAYDYDRKQYKMSVDCAIAHRSASYDYDVRKI